MSNKSNSNQSSTNQSPHWVDKVATSILKWQKKFDVKKLHVDDMKTPSGRVHTGALRGVLLHDLIAKALTEITDQEIHSTYVFNDMDPMDGLPHYLEKDEYQQHMGKPLYKIPAPDLTKCGIDLSKATEAELADFKKAKSFAEFYAYDFIHAFRKLGCSQKILWSHELYESGQMDTVIQTALDGVEQLKQVYREVADYELPEKWYPFQVFCPQCGKVGTTLVTDWDGKEVTFECQPHKVDWAEGCGYTGKISPLGGTGKLLWKVDWPAHWKTIGITVEGAGKDHTSAGGSRDMADAQCHTVFNILPPFNIPYEWILIRGTKMSSSKGVGTSAREFTELFPPEVGRFLFVNKNYNQVIDFDPTTMSIPDLFDEYDQAARIFWKQEEGDQRMGRAFQISQIEETPTAHYLPRFRDIATWMQYPEIDLIEKIEQEKGSILTEQEKEVIESRKQYAQVWLDRYAPQEFQLTPKEEMPQGANNLTDEQKTFLNQVEELQTSKTNWDPQEFQQAIFELAKESIGPRSGFQAIYLAYLGKKSGPRAAWFLLSIDQKLRQKRFDQITTAQKETPPQLSHQTIFENFADSKLFSVNKTFATAYPSATIGVAIIKGVTITKSNEQLSQEIQQFIEQQRDLTPEQVEHYPEIESYRQLYRDMKVNWHSRRSSPAALLRRIAQGKEFQSINTCVDAYNLVVMKHRISVGAFNLNQIKFPTQIKIAQGGEKILLLGDEEPTILKAGEISYFDQVGPYNLDFNYRDAQRTSVDQKVTNLLINVEGIYNISRHQVELALQETIETIIKYCGGKLEQAGIIAANNV